MSVEAQNNVKYSYFCSTSERRPCVTVAFCKVDEDTIAYGIAVASLSEKQAMYKIGKNIAKNRCTFALTNEFEVPWGQYNGMDNMQCQPHALSLVRGFPVNLGMAGCIPTEEFKAKLQHLRLVLPLGRHKIKAKV